MTNSRMTLGRLITRTQTATASDIAQIPYLKQHVGMFTVIQGKIGLKGAREWLLGIAILELLI